MNYPSSHKPTKLNLDRSYKDLQPDESFYLLNNETGINLHGGKGSNVGKSMPMVANFPACEMQMPAGENYNDGRYYSPITNETYYITYNSNGVNFISRINGAGVCEIVYEGPCLVLSPDPAHEVVNWRMFMHVDYLCSKVPGGVLKRLIWCDGTLTPIGCCDVEASIATNFFTTPFFERCADPCAAIQLCVPEPDGCLQAEWVPYNAATDANLSNRMLNKGFKFMYRYVYYDRRASEWSDRSSLYYQDAKGCFDNSVGFSRCMKLRIPIGNPHVEKIEFAFSEDGGLSWYKYDTIEKYKQYNTAQQYWYERDLSEAITGANFSESDCAFDYIFCNENQRIALDPLLVSREFNPMPIAPQGLIRIKESIGFYNYLKGTCPIDRLQVSKFEIGKDCPPVANTCQTKNVKVTVRAVIFQPSVELNVFIYRLTGGDAAPDDPTEAAWFSTTHSPLAAPPYIFTGYDQTFSGKTRNFIAYIEGTDYAGEMEQYGAKLGITSRVKVGVLSGMSAGTVVAKHRDMIAGGYYYFQEYTFNVPQGTKGFIRLASHHQQSGIGANQNTSTQVRGIGNDLRAYTGTTALDLSQNKNEIYFDACAPDDIDIKQFFIVEDMFTTETAGTPQQSSAYSGYITDANDQPVEGVRLFANGSFQVTTDHNGFYSFYVYDGIDGPMAVDIYAEQSCGDWTVIDGFSVSSSKGAMGVRDFQILDPVYITKDYAAVNVTVKDCSGVGVPGIRVAMSGSKYKVTGSDGVARFKLRNYDMRNRYITAVVMDKGGCFMQNCAGDCYPCMPSNNILLPPCFDTFVPVVPLPMLSLLNTTSINVGKKGLKPGARYAFGFIVEGDCGMLSAVNHVTYLDIPKVQSSGGLSFCSYTFNAHGMQLPLWGKRLKIVRSVNLNPFDLQWVVDDITRTADGKIILTIQSLNDYNAQYNFKTNTVYKYLPGDRVEFIRNGDGKIFDTATFGILNYLTLSPYNNQVLSGVTNDANYFNQLIIADDGKLDKLTIGAVIEIQTPSPVVTQPTYFEICVTLDVVDGELVVPSGIFDTFDTYLVHRQPGKFAAQIFESKTPSDFWGAVGADGRGLDDTGKVHFLDKYENQRRYGRNITVNSPTQLNYFGDTEKTFAGGQDDIITLVLNDDKVGAGISLVNNFLYEVSDGLLKLGTNGTVQATSADDFISNPQAKLRGKYGCSYADIGSIFFGDGFFTYIDSRNNAFIVHNYQLAKEAGEVLTTLKPKNVIESSCSSFFRKRIVDKENFNRGQTDFRNHYRYSTGMNKSTGKIFLTLKSWRMPAYNNEKALYLKPNDTIIYNPVNDEFNGFASFTPEGYSELNLNDQAGCAMLTFQNGVPYIHPVIANQWNTFFGISCDWIIGITLNKFPDKIKIPLALEIQSELMWFASQVTTDKAGFRSEIPPSRVKQNESKWNAAFLNNINSRSGLDGNENARGYYVNVVMVRDNTVGNIYNSIDNIKRQAYSEIDSILIKFMASESSGQTENL